MDVRSKIDAETEVEAEVRKELKLSPIIALRIRAGANRRTCVQKCTGWAQKVSP